MQEIDLQVKIENLLGSALRKFVMGDYTVAIQDLKAAEVLDRDNPEVWYNLGVNYCRIGLFQTAIEYFHKLLDSPHGFIDAMDVRKLLAFTLIKLNRFNEADTHLDRMLQLAPRDCTALNMKGYSLDARGKHDEALEVYESVLNIDSRNSNACNSIAYLQAREGMDLGRAHELASRACEMNGNNPAYIDTLGYVYLKMGLYEKAGPLFSSALDRAPMSDEIQKHIRELQSIIK
jgi:tetratricopeptide (TPR) repeat protein